MRTYDISDWDERIQKRAFELGKRRVKNFARSAAAYATFPLWVILIQLDDGIADGIYIYLTSTRDEAVEIRDEIFALRRQIGFKDD